MLGPASWVTIDDYVRAAGFAHRARDITQTVAGTHAAGSRHYLGEAVDYGRADSEADQIAVLLTPLATGPGAPLVELYGSNGVSLRDGVPVPEPPGHAGNHTHAAIRPGATLTGAPGRVGATSGRGTGASQAGAGALAALGSPSLIMRIGEVALGALLVLMGLVGITRALNNLPKGALPT